MASTGGDLQLDLPMSFSSEQQRNSANLIREVVCGIGGEFLTHFPYSFSSLTPTVQIGYYSTEFKHTQAAI